MYPCVILYEYIEVNNEKAGVVEIDLIIRSRINAMQERAYFSPKLFCMLSFGKNFPALSL